MLCYSLDGGYLSGSFAADTGEGDCGATWTIRGVSATYTVGATSLAGTWAAESQAGDYTMDNSGSRSAELHTTTPDGATTRVADWTPSSRSATTVDFAVSSITVRLSYSAFAGHRWEASVSGDAAGPVGSVTVDDGSVTCSTGGTWESPSVNCL
ncbi:MAG: hypothetical protein KDA24_25015 [Deltaproteobacteria bacterium]|nr:hypothetical protein [Deltaproteobacteria bacterium]